MYIHSLTLTALLLQKFGFWTFKWHTLLDFFFVELLPLALLMANMLPNIFAVFFYFSIHLPLITLFCKNYNLKSKGIEKSSTSQKKKKDPFSHVWLLCLTRVFFDILQRSCLFFGVFGWRRLNVNVFFCLIIFFEILMILISCLLLIQYFLWCNFSNIVQFKYKYNDRQ